MPVPRISREELSSLLQADDPSTRPVLVDARLKYPYEHSTVTLPGAVRIAPGTTDFSALPAGRFVVVYDSDPSELAASEVVAALQTRGYRAAALTGGLPEWMAGNLPTEAKDTPGGPAAGAPQE